MLTIKFSTVSKLKKLNIYVVTMVGNYLKRSFTVQHPICCPIVLQNFPQNGQVSSPLLNPVNESKCEKHQVVVLIFSTTSILILFFMIIFKYI